MAMNAEHAIELLENNKYSMVMFKTALPDISDGDFIKKLRNHQSEQIANLPILIASGNTVIHEQEAVIAAGASSFLPKPFTKKELFNAIEKLIR